MWVFVPKMLHHYNYSTSLSHFLSYHHLEEQQLSENEHQSAGLCEDLSQEDPRCRSNSSASNNKSFTIAAILGLKNDNNQDDSATDLSVVNLSVHHPQVSSCSRLQLPVRHNSSAVSVTGHFGHGCPQRQTGWVDRIASDLGYNFFSSERIETSLVVGDTE